MNKVQVATLQLIVALMGIILLTWLGLIYGWDLEPKSWGVILSVVVVQLLRLLLKLATWDG